MGGRKMKPNRATGRPRQLYDPARTPGIVRALARAGHTNAEMADLLNVSSKCLWQWRDKYPEVRAALDDGKSVADQMVVDALYKRALGYEYDVEDAETLYVPNAQGNPIIKSSKKVRKHINIPPDVGAICFWLKNRRPDEWRDVYKGEVSANIILSVIPPPKPNAATEPTTN